MANRKAYGRRAVLPCQNQAAGPARGAGGARFTRAGVPWIRGDAPGACHQRTSDTRALELGRGGAEAPRTRDVDPCSRQQSLSILMLFACMNRG